MKLLCNFESSRIFNRTAAPSGANICKCTDRPRYVVLWRLFPFLTKMARSRRGGPKCNVQRHPSGHHARELTNTCSTLDLGFQCIGTFTTPVLSQCHVLQHEGPRRGSAISAAVQVNRVWQQRQVPQGACNCHHATSAARVAMSAIGKKLLLFCGQLFPY